VTFRLENKVYDGEHFLLFNPSEVGSTTRHWRLGMLLALMESTYDKYSDWHSSVMV
jgi:hypothetical protein